MFCGETIIPKGLRGSQLSFKFTIRVNGDGDVNIIDLIRAKKQVAGIIALTGISFDAADLDSNNVVNAVDLSLLRKMLLIIKS